MELSGRAEKRNGMGVYLGECKNTNMKLSVFLLSLILVACSIHDRTQKEWEKRGNQVDKNTSPSSSLESFEEFKKKFISDSVFQKNHIAFPLYVANYDIDAAGFISSRLSANDWAYMNFELKKQYSFKIKSVGDTIKMNVQMAENGVSVDYLFTIIKNNWMLVGVLDQST